MRSRFVVLLIAIASIFWFAPTTSSVAEPFEVRFWPASSVYRVTLSEDEHLYDCVIHNVAIVNRTPAPLLLQRIEYQFLRKGEIVQSRVVTQSEIDARAERIFTFVTDPDPFKKRGVPIYFVGLEDAEGPKFLHSGDLVTRGSN